MSKWKEAVWDRPKNGTRYYVRKKSVDGYDMATDDRDGVLTFSSRAEAARYAAELNAASIPAHIQSAAAAQATRALGGACDDR